MKCYRQPSNIQGQGLIEILIAMLIIFVSVVALMNFQAGLAYNNILNQQRSDATILATSELETLRDFQVINNQSPYTSYQNIASGSSTSVSANTTYTLTWAVTPTTSPIYKTVDIKVSWTDSRGTAQTIELTTIVASVDPASSSTIMG